MRKLTLLIASCIVVFGVFGQKKIQKLNLPSPQVQQLNTAPNTNSYEELSQQLIDQAPRTPSGHIRCFTTESEQLRRLTDPTVKSPEEMRAWLDQIVKANQENPSPTQKATRNIPVVVHVIHNGDPVGTGENISDAQVLSQIAALNADFSATNPDFSNTPSIYQSVATNMDIQFCMAQTDPNGQPTNGIDRVQLTAADYANQAAVQAIKPGTQWDPTKYFNIWVFRPSASWGILGYAQFPNSGAANTDGLAVAYYAYGTTGAVSAPYNKGRTATHEMGHCLGLYHIWGDDGTACTGSDGVADTPNQADENYGCPNFATNTSCGNSGDMSMNYMDYTDDACMYMFTDGQKAVVDAVLASAPRRASLLTSTVCNAAAITADFTADVTTINVGGTVNFTDQSVSPNTLNSWTWSFPGGSTTSFNGQNPPAITYNAVGQYDVTLTVTDNASGTDTKTKTQYINVINAGACDTLLNIADTDTLRIYSTAQGYAAGYNEYGLNSHAEKYSGYSPYTYVTGGLVYFYDIVDGGNGATVDFNIWNDAGSAPGTIIGTVSYTLTDLANALTGTPKQGLIEVIFDNPVNVGTGPFYIGVTLNGFTTGDKLGMVSNSVYDPTPNSAYTLYNGNWYAYNGLFTAPSDYSLYISPYMSQDVPTATISTNTTTICAGDAVNFDASSSTNTTGYDWVFNGGTPSTSTNTTESVTYATAGSPRAYLIAYGNCGSYALDSVDITVNPSEDGTFNYGASSYCVNASDPTPTKATSGGTFTSTPAGLSINSSTGMIDVSASTPGTYTVTYTTAGSCPGTSNTSITINALDDASFSYGASSYCANASNPTPTITGTTGGTFSSTAGLSINSSTGAINLAASTAGTYTVTYTTSGSCPASSNTSVTINAVDDASFSYSSSSYCLTASNPTPTITGVAGGTFTSSPAGLSINASTGTITTSSSTIGTYTVTYTTAGTCPSSSNVTVTINSSDDASFNYSASSYCQDGSDPSATVTGTTGGTFSSTSGLSINASTGMIDVSASTPGTYTVTYSTSGSCSASSNTSVTINAADDASFSYSGSSYCQDGSDPSATITGTTGGTFSSTAGLSINASTGMIDVSASTPGTYTVTYTTSGTCPASSNVSVTINAVDNASFNYGASSYCQDGSDPSATITGTTGGTFSSATGLSINASTGMIDVSASTPGTYTVTYTTSGSCPASSNTSVTINAADDASFNYSGSNYCQTDSDPSATITGTTGGTFSSTTGLSINASTGMIDVSASTPGTYTVTYTTSGTCSASSNVSVTINATEDASFSYSASSYCQDGSDPSATITGTTGGTFSSTTGLSINASTGMIDVSASTPGTYTVTYTTSVSSCAASSNVSVTINAVDVATISYPKATYCVNEADASPTQTGVSGGNYTSTPSGLVLNGTTGVIGVGASSAGTYTVSYTTTGVCPTVASTTVVIDLCTGIDKNTVEGIKVYPNPASSILTIESDNQEVNQIRLINILGETLITKNAQSTKTIVNVEELSMGVYFIQLFDKSGNIVSTQKVSIK